MKLEDGILLALTVLAACNGPTQGSGTLGAARSGIVQRDRCDEIRAAVRADSDSAVAMERRRDSVRKTLLCAHPSATNLYPTVEPIQVRRCEYDDRTDVTAASFSYESTVEWDGALVRGYVTKFEDLIEASAGAGEIEWRFRTVILSDSANIKASDTCGFGEWRRAQE